MFPVPRWLQRLFMTRAALGRRALSSQCRRVRSPGCTDLFPVLCLPCDMLTTRVMLCLSCHPVFHGFPCNVMNEENLFPAARTAVLCGSASPHAAIRAPPGCPALEAASLCGTGQLWKMVLTVPSVAGQPWGDAECSGSTGVVAVCLCPVFLLTKTLSGLL